MRYAAALLGTFVFGVATASTRLSAEELASPAAADPSAVITAWVEGHRTAQHDSDLLAREAVLETAGMPAISGADAIVAFMDVFYGAIGNRTITVETEVAGGDQVAVLLRVLGTHTGPLLGVPPTGNDVDVQLAAFVDISGGRIQRIRAVFDAAGLIAQIGAAPASGPERAATPPT